MRRWERQSESLFDGDWYPYPTSSVGTFLVVAALVCALVALCVVWP